MKSTLLLVTVALALALLSASDLALGQARKAAPSNEPTVEDAMSFLASQIELDENVKTVRRLGPTTLRVARLRTSPFKDGRMEVLEFNVAEFDEHLISGAAASLRCARKGCVRYMSEASDEVTREESRVSLDASSSLRATRMVQAASLVREKAGKKAPF